MPFDRSKYPADWEEISQRILKRDNYSCVTCGKKSGWYAQVNGVWYVVNTDCKKHFESKGERVFKMTLACMHLNHDPSDSSDSNLITGCVWCHLKHDHSYQQMSRKFGKNYREVQRSLFE